MELHSAAILLVWDRQSASWPRSSCAGGRASAATATAAAGGGGAGGAAAASVLLRRPIRALTPAPTLPRRLGGSLAAQGGWRSRHEHGATLGRRAGRVHHHQSLAAN